MSHKNYVAIGAALAAIYFIYRGKTAPVNDAIESLAQPDRQNPYSMTTLNVPGSGGGVQIQNPILNADLTVARNQVINPAVNQQSAIQAFSAPSPQVQTITLPGVTSPVASVQPITTVPVVTAPNGVVANIPSSPKPALVAAVIATTNQAPPPATVIAATIAPKQAPGFQTINVGTGSFQISQAVGGRPSIVAADAGADQKGAAVANFQVAAAGNKGTTAADLVKAASLNIAIQKDPVLTAAVANATSALINAQAGYDTNHYMAFNVAKANGVGMFGTPQTVTVYVQYNGNQTDANGPVYAMRRYLMGAPYNQGVTPPQVSLTPGGSKVALTSITGGSATNPQNVMQSLSLNSGIR